MKNRVGLRIKAARKQRGFSQAELASELGRSTDTVSAIERGKSLPNFETLEGLAKALNVPVRDFFDFDEDDESSPRRAALMAEIAAVVRSLPDRELTTALGVLQALVNR